MRPPKLLAAALGLVAVTTAAAPGWGPYVVHRGDTLWGLAQDHHTSVAAIQQQNNLRSGAIYAGQTLQIPGLGAGVPATAAPQVTTTVAATRAYVVRSGDTLTSVARTQQTTVGALAALNHLSGRLTIRIGQQLQLPAPPAVVSVPAHPAAQYAASIAASAQALGASADPGPAAIQAMVRAESVRQGVPAALGQAFAAQESGFQMRVVSTTGAIGVMQLMPQTAQWLQVNPYDLASNIRGGVALVHALLQQAGSVPNAVAGYYQGLPSVQAHGMYADTQRYVASVLALQAHFR